jgi:hypothetical protein
MPPTTRAVKKHAKAGQRRRFTAQERLVRDRRQAQQGIHVRRDTLLSIAYSEELIFPMSATLQSTDRRHGIVGQECCHFQLHS